MSVERKCIHSSLKNISSNFHYFFPINQTNIKKIIFDESSIALKEKIGIKRPKEPKTPYVEYEGEDKYLTKIKQINNFDLAVGFRIT